MPEVLAKITSAPHPWVVSADPAGLLTLTPTAPLVVQYSTGGSDTVPAGVPATECPLDAGYVWCPYLFVGDGTLHAVKESEIATLAGDWTILGHVHQHEVVPHQIGGAGGRAAISFIINGAGSAIPTGYAGSLVVPYGCTVLSCTLLSDASTSTEMDIQRDDYASYPSSTSLVASAPPTITTDVKSQDTTLTGWTTALVAGDILRYLVTTNSASTELTCVLLVAR